jgi:predicted transcriptional regulator
METYQILSELSSKNRLGILKVLDSAPATFTSLAKEVGLNSTEMSRQLSRLTDAELIEKKGDGKYHNTNLGKLIISYISGLDLISENSVFFNQHDTGSIPIHLRPQMGAFSSVEFAEGVYNIMNILEERDDDLSSYVWFMAPDFPRHHLSGLDKHLNEGLEIRAIITENLLESLEKGVEATNKIKIRTVEKVKISVVSSDGFSMVQLGSDDRFRKWCDDLFQYYWDKANTL